MLLRAPYHQISYDKIKQIEVLRKEYALSDEFIWDVVGTSRILARGVVRNMLADYQRTCPDASEKNAWIFLLSAHIENHRDAVTNGLSTGSCTSVEAAARIDLLKEASDRAEERIGKMHSFEQLCDYLFNLEQRLHKTLAQVEAEGPPGVAKRILEILERE